MSATATANPSPTAAEHAAAMYDYMRDGERRARELANRGPVRFKDGNTLVDEILDAYWQHGFYVLEGVIAVAIDARRQHFPDEVPYRYRPFDGLEDDYRYGPETYERVVRDYNTRDLGI